MHENIVKFGLELGATLQVYLATFYIFRILRSNFSEIYERNWSMPKNNY